MGAHVTPVDVSAIYANIAFLKFDEGMGNTAFDTTPNNNNASLVNSPTWSYSRDGYALTFAAGKYLLTNDNQTLNPTAALSVAAWINSSDWSGTPTILQKGTTSIQYRLFASGGNLTFEIPGVGFVSAPLTSTNAWHFVAGTYNGSLIRLYIDGAAVAGTAGSGILQVTTNPLVIGAADQTGSASKTFRGLIDNVKLFGRGITSDEVQAIYAAPTIDLTPPVASSPAFSFDASPNALSFVFSEDVSSSLSAISVTNLTTSTTVSPTGYSFNSGTNTATFTFEAPLADGNYRATLDASQVHDTSGNAMSSNFVFDYFFLNADANHDRSVDTSDFNVLASSFSQTGRTFSQGDFNYDGTVDTLDFNLLAAEFSKVLAAAPAPPPPAPVAVGPTFTLVALTDDDGDSCGCGCGNDIKG